LVLAIISESKVHEAIVVFVAIFVIDEAARIIAGHEEPSDTTRAIIPPPKAEVTIAVRVYRADAVADVHAAATPVAWRNGLPQKLSRTGIILPPLP